MIADKINQMNKLYPFHMPGHKRNKNFFADNLIDLDMTEIFGLDNLHCADGIIKQAQDDCAKIFGAEHSFFIVNGGSCAVMAAIFSVCNENDKIIVMRGSHKSLYYALELLGVDAYYLYPKKIFGISCGFDYDELERLLVKTNAKAVFVTSPNYEGFCLDIGKICELVHRHKKFLIVDEAHGSHFVFHNEFPLSALKLGGDVVINSLHKTLPVLTQSAVLHINNASIDLDRVKKYLAMFQTSSPSYIFMSVMDSVLKKISVPGFFNAYVKKLLALRRQLQNNKVIRLVNESDIQNSSLKNLDISKLTFIVNSDLTPLEIEKILREKFKLQIEMCGLNHFVALSTIADTDFGFDLLLKSIAYLENNLPYKKLVFDNVTDLKPQKVCSIKKAASAPKKIVTLNDCVGKISSDYIIPYPPGVPLIVPGELISLDAVKMIEYYLNRGINVMGVAKRSLSVLDCL